MTNSRLVVCFDGTWNSPDKGDKPTNVVKMVRAVRNRGDDGAAQVAFYDKGVGTAGGTDTLTGGGLGVGLTANIMDGYRFLGNNYEPGDEIYIFGFSRGAYAARSLAGLIGLAGLLTSAHLGRGLRDVMDIYQKKDLTKPQKQAEIARLPVGERREVTVRCLGVWDTVGSLGIPGDLGRRFLGGKYYFHDVELGPCVDVALHAIAIDEKRGAFAPALWVSETGRPVRHGQTVEQVWFAGAHSNVGGSYPDSGLSDIAFDWMVRRVGANTSLALDGLPEGAVGPENAAAQSIDSRTALYAGSRLYPYQRIVDREIPAASGFGEWFRGTFPSLDRRNIPSPGRLTVNEALHVSVLERWRLPSVPHDCRNPETFEKVPYRPVNLSAVIRAHHQGRTMPVVGWNGERTDAASVPWPDIADETTAANAGSAETGMEIA